MMEVVDSIRIVAKKIRRAVGRGQRSRYRPYFTLRDARQTLTIATKASGLEGAIYAGLEALTNAFLGREWRRDDGAMRGGNSLPLTSTVGCSGVTLCLALNDKGHHDEADASCMFWVRRTATGTRWLDFVYKRLQFVNYPEIQVKSLRIRYLGELENPTVQMFTPPTP